MAAVTIDPGSSALLIQDMQNDIVKSDRPLVPMGGAALIASCQRLLNKAREEGMTVIYVQVIRRRDGRDAPRTPLGAAPAAGGPALIQGTTGAEIVSELAPQSGDPIVTKHTTSPFNTTDIEVYLRRFGIDTLLLTGYSTTGVVEGSLRDARDKDYSCVVVRDCCAAATEQEQNTCMEIVFPRMAWVAGVDEVIAAIRG